LLNKINSQSYWYSVIHTLNEAKITSYQSSKT